MYRKKILIVIIGIVCLGGVIILSNNVKKEQINNVAKEEKGQNSISEQVVATNSGATDIVINKSEITSTAKFYKYKSGNTDMEVIAVRSGDGRIKTALNTCQVCYDSGRGFYVQQGNYLVCQNCGNKFHIDQVEKVKGGCNPIPILSADKTEDTNTVIISKLFLDSQEKYFSNWGK